MLIYQALAVLLAIYGISMIYIWIHIRFRPKTWAIALLIFASSIWSICSLFEGLIADYQIKFLCNQIEYVGIVAVPIMWFIFSLQISGLRKWISGRNLIILGIIPCITLILDFSNGFHNLFWALVKINEANLYSQLIKVWGPWFYIHTAYSYSLVLAGVYLIVKTTLRARYQLRWQVIPLLISPFVPWVINIFETFYMNLTLDITPLIIGVTALILSYNMFNVRVADIVPVAHAAIIEGMKDAVIVLDSGNRILELNPSAQRMMGKKPSESLGKPIEEVWDIGPQITGPPSDTGSANKEVELDMGGSRHIFEYSISQLVDWSGDTESKLVVFHDITELKTMETEVRHYSEQLEQIIEKKTSQLRDAQRLAAIGETAIMVGHDLRNPLQAMINTLYLTKDQVEASKLSREDKEQIYEFYEGMGKQIDYMNKIVSDLTDYATPLRLDFHLTDFNTLIREVLKSIKMPKNIIFTCDVDSRLPLIEIDLLYMQRVFTNLITNAIQAMPNGGELRISAFRAGEEAVMSVNDTGMGMSEEIISKIFKPLVSGKPKGMGMGLAVCKRLVDAHDGTISAESKLGAGASFIVRIPIRQKEKALAELPVDTKY